MASRYHHPRHPCAGQDAYLSERAHRRLTPPRTAVHPAFAALGERMSELMAGLSRVKLADHSLVPPRPAAPEPRSIADMLLRLRARCAALTAAEVTDVATLTAGMNLMPAAVPLLRAALERAAADGLVQRAGRSAYGEMLFALQPATGAATVIDHEHRSVPRPAAADDVRPDRTALPRRS
ncbi:hypothetical protein AB0A05_27000 [Streptomyces sp. NPDC046374]|uniref:hypothetical protein n=1 Tax=Streptomyces sp. NPDC046374 TaxID=3154917 RepID=UPI0033C222B7